MKIKNEGIKSQRTDVITRNDGSRVKVKIIYEIDETTEGPIKGIYEFDDGQKRVVLDDLVDMRDCQIWLGGDVLTWIEDDAPVDKIPSTIRFVK